MDKITPEREGYWDIKWTNLSPNRNLSKAMEKLTKEPSHHTSSSDMGIEDPFKAPPKKTLKLKEMERESLFPRKKKSMNPFIVFRTMACRELASANPGITNVKISAMLGKQWNQMSDTNKLKYKQLAKRLENAKNHFPPHLPSTGERISLKERLYGPATSSRPKSRYDPVQDADLDHGSDLASIGSPALTSITWESGATLDYNSPIYSPSEPSSLQDDALMLKINIPANNIPSS